MPELPSPSSAFHGVCFFLHGFDPEHLQNVRSKLTDGGAVDAGRYGPNCTHVIVDNTVYDDPVCVTARKDRKTVVTSLWVDHSFDVGLPVDASSVMYRPLKNLKGIPGAHSLIMCLTGYQRQDRDDIMTMVGLMGAQFSKPLVANKVTHLICYKFEGEKYELAKKIKKIKLVNHRWLEDCLKHWKILPEDNYNESGFELEMEAEAKDSEEETENNVVGQAMETATGKTAGMVSYSLPPTSAGKSSELLNHESTAKSGASLLDAKPLVSTPVKKLSIGGATKDPNLPGCQYEGSLKVGSPYVHPEAQGNTPLGDTSHKKLKTTAESGGASPFDAEYSSLSYSRKTPIRSPSTLFHGGRLGDVNPSLEGKSEEVGDVTKEKMDNTRSRSPLKEIEVPDEILRNKFLDDQKSKASCAHSNIQMSSPCVKPCNPGSPFNRTGAQKQVADFIEQPHVSNTHCANEKHSINGLENELASVPANTSLDLAPSRNPTSRDDCCDNDSEAVAKTSFFIPRKPSYGRSPSIGDIVEDGIKHRAGDLAKEEILLETTKVESPGSKGADTVKSFESGTRNVPGTINSKVATNPTRKKSLARKTLGARKKIDTPANRKGSICLSKAASNISAARTETLCANDDSSHMANMVEVSILCDASEVVQEAKNMNGVNMENSTENTAVGMDDETEPAEEKNDLVCEWSINDDGKKKVELEKKTAASFEGLHADRCNVNTSQVGTRVNEIGSTDQGQNHEPVESTPVEESNHSSAGRKSKAVHAFKENIGLNKCADGERKEKMVKGRNASRTAHKGNSPLTSRSSRKADEKKPVEAGKGDMDKQEKMKSVSTIVGKGNNWSKKSRSARKVEEQKPVDEGERAMDVQEKATCSVGKAKNDVVELDNLESAVGRLCSESDGKRMKVNKEAEKTNASSTAVKASEGEAVQPAWFILSGSRPQRKEFQSIIRCLKGRFCRDSHQWSYQATHFIAPDPIRRTEKFFAAAASGSWILKPDYLKASSQVGKFLDEKPFEWHQKGLSQDGAINLEAPRKWRLLRENTGHGAFYGMRVMIYGECIAPPLDTLKRVIKAGDGTILATCPPYNKFLNSGVNFVIVTPGMPRVDLWVQEFLKHEIPCVVADYIVEYVCKPGYSLEKHVLYNTHAWAEKSFSRLQGLAKEVVLSDSDDLHCEICGSADRGEVMLICGDETGSVGCGIGTHMDCCSPPLKAVPEEDWLCPKCSKGSSCKRKRRPR